MPMRRRRSEDAVAETFELAALADGSLSPERRSELEARVGASPELGDLLAEQRQAVSLTRSVVAEVEAPAGLRRRIEAERVPSPRRRPRRLALAGAAAAVAAAAAVGAVALTSGGSPAGFRAALTPTGLAPGAGGEATLTRRPSGWRVELDATGLPRLAGGAFYEAWLRNDAGVLVPIGTFNEGRDVTLWAGVPPTSFATLTVTRERLDGDQGSSGEKVLVGTVTQG
jgi:Anti-sigma-K factor rskA